MIDPEAVLREADRLPIFPASVAKLLQRLRDPEVTARDIEATLLPDPVLTARLLKLANSSYYRSVGAVGTLKDAVVRLGLRPIFSLATSSALAQVVPAQLPGYRIDAQAFLAHSTAVAVFAERIARRHAPEVEREAFTSGLLHDLGKLVVGTLLAKDPAGLLERLNGEQLTLLDAERELLGTDHGEVGELVCTRWRLPPLIGAAARHHHAPARAESPEARRLCQVIHLADALTHLFGFSTDVGELQRSIDPEVISALGVLPGGLEAIAADATPHAEQMIAMMASDAR